MPVAPNQAKGKHLAARSLWPPEGFSGEALLEGLSVLSRTAGELETLRKRRISLLFQTRSCSLGYARDNRIDPRDKPRGSSA